VNTGHRQGLGFFIFLGTKKFNFKSASSSFWRNKQSVKLKIFNNSPITCRTRLYSKELYNSHRHVIVQATFKKTIFLTIDFLSLSVGFQQITPKRNILPNRSFPTVPWSWSFKHCWKYPLCLSCSCLLILKVIFSLTFSL
jgi:hypothetical protein